MVRICPTTWSDSKWRPVAYGTLRNETKRNGSLRNGTLRKILGEIVLCVMINRKICKLVATYKATLVSNWNGLVFVSHGSIFTLRTPRLANTK